MLRPQLAPCALRAAHVHMRASGLLYVVDANALAVAVVLPDGPAVVNTITTGASTVFPQGASVAMPVHSTVHCGKTHDIQHSLWHLTC